MSRTIHHSGVNKALMAMIVISGTAALRTGGQVNLDFDLDDAEAFVPALDG